MGSESNSEMNSFDLIFTAVELMNNLFELECKKEHDHIIPWIRAVWIKVLGPIFL
jgi:hypothetical protein